MRSLRSERTATSCMIRYPCFSPSASANRTKNTTGESGRRASGLFESVWRFGIEDSAWQSISLNDISLNDSNTQAQSVTYNERYNETGGRYGNHGQNHDSRQLS